MVFVEVDIQTNGGVTHERSTFHRVTRICITTGEKIRYRKASDSVILPSVRVRQLTGTFKCQLPFPTISPHGPHLHLSLRPTLLHVLCIPRQHELHGRSSIGHQP